METGLGGTAGNRCCEKSHPCIALVVLPGQSLLPFLSGFQTKLDGRGFSFIFLSFFFPLDVCVCLAIIYCVILKLVNLDMMIYF